MGLLKREETMMRQKSYIWLIFISILALNGCQSVIGNVVPEGGPSMENVYDSMGVAKDLDRFNTNSNAEADLERIRQTKIPLSYAPAGLNTFRKLPNPELNLYIYPHFAGTDEIPIPGYYTTFSAYDRTHYALASETTH
jgi:conjugative transfer region lipoprotein (TIGR03751 family)